MRTVVAVAWIVMAVVSVFVGARRDAHQDAQLSGLVETVSRERDLHAFRPGAGATGLAFQRKELILVTGDAVSDDTYGLTPDQQDYFAGYGAVVATPIWREGNHPIGVLSAIGEGDDGHFELSSSRAALRELADVIAVVITSVYHTEVQ